MNRQNAKKVIFMKKISREKEIFKLIYGNHPKSMNLWADAEKVFDAFTKKEVWERYELAKEIGLNFSDEIKKKDETEWANNKKKFYNIISPLLERLIVSSQDRAQGKVYYRVSYDKAGAWMEDIKRSLYYKFGKWVKVKVP